MSTLLFNPYFTTFFPFFIVVLAILAIFWQKRRVRSDLEERNRALLAAKRLNKIILENLDFNIVAQKIADTIPNELKFGTGVLAMVEPGKGVIRRIAASNTSEAINAIKAIKIPFNQIEISIHDAHNLMARAIREKKPYISADVYDVLGPVLTREEASKIQQIMNTRTTLIYPIFLGNMAIGVLVASTSKEKDRIAKYELEMIENFVESAGIALQHAILYKNVQDKTDQLTKITKDVISLNKQLEQLDKVKDDFVSIASHELRTPMTAIRSYAWMALYKPDEKLTEKMKRYLSRTLISTERLINLVNDMLNISRIESGRIEISPRVFDIQSLASDVITEVSPKAAEKSLQIHLLTAQLPEVFADPDKVHQVLLNLIGNAMKFTPNGNQILVSFMSDGQMVDISVKDHGVGINKEDLSRLFAKFGRLDNSYVAAATSGGTGLGLYICKSLVELMKGKIWASSEGSGKGTTFTFTLPVASKEALSHKDLYSIKVAGDPKFLEPVAI